MKRFYEALTTGKEFKDDSWKAWTTYHPADVQAADAQVLKATRDSVRTGSITESGSQHLQTAKGRSVRACLVTQVCGPSQSFGAGRCIT